MFAPWGIICGNSISAKILSATLGDFLEQLAGFDLEISWADDRNSALLRNAALPSGRVCPRAEETEVLRQAPASPAVPAGTKDHCA